MSVVSQSNKQMLFDLLKSIGNDNNLVINDNQLMSFITQKCGYFHANRFEFDFGNDLNEINKKIVEQGYNYVMSNQPRKVPQTTPKQQQPQLSKREMFDVGLASQEEQFKKMINPKKPKSGLNNLFSKLKQKTPNSDIINKLDTIISNQERILELLTSKKEREIQVDEVNLSSI